MLVEGWLVLEEAEVWLAAVYECQLEDALEAGGLQWACAC